MPRRFISRVQRIHLYLGVAAISELKSYFPEKTSISEMIRIVIEDFLSHAKAVETVQEKYFGTLSEKDKSEISSTMRL